jgi:hypothetical protein
VTSFLSLSGEEADALPARAVRACSGAAGAARRLAGRLLQAPRGRPDAPASGGGAPRLALQSGRWARPRPRGWLPAALAAARRVGPGAGRAAALVAAVALLLGAAAAVGARARTDAHAAALLEARGGCAWRALTEARPVCTHAP